MTLSANALGSNRLPVNIFIITSNKQRTLTKRKFHIQTFSHFHQHLYSNARSKMILIEFNELILKYQNKLTKDEGVHILAIN